jgi:uncharacterized protein (DUF1499 family)
MSALLAALEEHANSKIKKVSHYYVHAEFTSKFFGFVDDVEFCMNDHLKIIHVKSASRKGYFDFGVNRRRIERIRREFRARITPRPVSTSP